METFLILLIISCLFAFCGIYVQICRKDVNKIMDWDQLKNKNGVESRKDILLIIKAYKTNKMLNKNKRWFLLKYLIFLISPIFLFIIFGLIIFGKDW